MDNLDQLYADYGSEGDAGAMVSLAEQLQSAGDLHGAATAYDRAFGLAPHDKGIQSARMQLLDALSVNEHGIEFRYIPAGTFLMGSEGGDPDEQPIHPAQLGHYWLAETPMSWARFSILMGWEMPPDAVPMSFNQQYETATDEQRHALFRVANDNKIRRYYCRVEPSEGEVSFSQPLTKGLVDTFQAMAIYDEKPMVAASWEMADQLCAKMSTKTIRYRLPSEAEWEKGARGGLIGATYAWGDDPPNDSRCDFDHFGTFEIAPIREFPPNEYGLYGMCGGVWEWTSDWYDALYYADSPRKNPRGPLSGEEPVLRGGSWADGKEAITVSFRMSSRDSSCPNIGFRLCRVTG